MEFTKEELIKKMFFNFNPNNLYAINIKEKYEKLSVETLREIYEADEREKEDINIYQLKRIKIKRALPKKGDIFVLSPKEGLYFYGKVLNHRVDSDGVNLFVIVIFKTKTREISLKDYKENYDDLLLPPSTVTKWYWTTGKFFTIGNDPSGIDDLDYGFYNSPSFGDVLQPKGVFLDKNRNIIDREPKIWGTAGVKSLNAVGMLINEAGIIDKSLLE